MLLHHCCQRDVLLWQAYLLPVLRVVAALICKEAVCLICWFGTCANSILPASRHAQGLAIKGVLGLVPLLFVHSLIPNKIVSDNDKEA